MKNKKVFKSEEIFLEKKIDLPPLQKKIHFPWNIRFSKVEKSDDNFFSLKKTNMIINNNDHH